MFRISIKCIFPSSLYCLQSYHNTPSSMCIMYSWKTFTKYNCAKKVTWIQFSVSVIRIQTVGLGKFYNFNLIILCFRNIFFIQFFPLHHIMVVIDNFVQSYNNLKLRNSDITQDFTPLYDKVCSFILIIATTLWMKVWTCLLHSVIFFLLSSPKTSL